MEISVRLRIEKCNSRVIAVLEINVGSLYPKKIRASCLLSTVDARTQHAIKPSFFIHVSVPSTKHSGQVFKAFLVFRSFTLTWFSFACRFCSMKKREAG